MKKSRLARKMITGITAAGVMALGVMPVCAANENTGELKVGYTEASTYTLSIPQNVTLSEKEEVSQSIGISAVNVGTKEKVQIKVSQGISDKKVSLADVKDPANIAKSTVSLTSGGEGISIDTAVAEFKGTSIVPIMGGVLYFSPLNDVPAGTYNGTITFSADIVEMSGN